MATYSKNSRLLKIGDSMPDFELPGVDGKSYSATSFAGKKALVIIFSCNHCPYVQGWEGRLVAIQKEYEGKGVQLAAINANDETEYPDDSFEQMVKRSKEKGFNFPYLRDQDQAVAKAFDAACTPEIYVFDQERLLRYHGRVDDNYQVPNAVKSHDLKNALDDLVSGRPVKTPETPAMGCSIKWGAA